VLIVDPHEVSRGAIRALLRTEGLDVVADVASAERALAIGESTAPDVVILDISSGPEQATADARALALLGSAPTVALTSSTPATVELDGFAFIAKPDVCARQLRRATRPEDNLGAALPALHRDRLRPPRTRGQRRAGIGVERVAVYEAPFIVHRADKRPPADYGRRLDDLIAADDRSGAVTHFMRNGMGMPAPAVLAMKLMPMWKHMKANAPTLRYDWAALGEHNMQGDSLRPSEWASVTAPALVICGGKTSSTLRNGSRALAEVLPNAELRMLDGMGHRLKVKPLVPVLAAFLAGQGIDPRGARTAA
jgi:CheY-like chemotaxis protein